MEESTLQILNEVHYLVSLCKPRSTLTFLIQYFSHEKQCKQPVVVGSSAVYGNIQSTELLHALHSLPFLLSNNDMFQFSASSIYTAMLQLNLNAKPGKRSSENNQIFREYLEPNLVHKVVLWLNLPSYGLQCLAIDDVRISYSIKFD